MMSNRTTEKYIAFWEIDPEKTQHLNSKACKLRKLTKEFPYEFPRSIFGPYSWEGETRGFQVFEASAPEQLDRLAEYWHPEVKLDFQPIEATKIWEIHNRVRYEDTPIIVV